MGFLPPTSQAKEKYEKSLEELNKCTPQYMESMEQVFDQCQQHEVKRLTFLKEALLDIKRHLNLTENQRSVCVCVRDGFQPGELMFSGSSWKLRFHHNNSHLHNPLLGQLL